MGGWLLLLAVVNLAARLPLCWDPANVDNDGAEYLAIARSLQISGQYATDLKWHFFTDDPVRHVAWGDRPPLYPFFAVLCQRLLPFLDPTAAARVGNALMACVALVLVSLYLRRMYGERLALLAAGYVFMLPHMVYWTTQPMTETLTLALTYGGLLLWSPPLPRRHGDTEQDGEDRREEEKGVRTGDLRAVFRGLGVGVMAGLTYLARPAGAVLLPAALFDLGLRHRHRKLHIGNCRWLICNCALLGGFALIALPFHLWLRHLYDSPTHSALGFTFAVRTFYEITYYGFGRPRPTVGGMLAQHGWEIPGLILHQVWRHAQSLVPPVAGLLPLAFWMRRRDWAGERCAGALYVVLLVLVHTITWAAWGSSRYFLPCFPILVAGLLSVVGRERDAPPLWLVRACGWATGLGLLVAVGLFYRTQLRPDHGLPSLPLWRDAANIVRGSRLVAADKPSVLNLLLETPAVRLPRTTDRALLERFIREYRPDALVLFADEPVKQASAWRSGALPPGWRLVVNRNQLLIARPIQPEPNGG